MYRRAPDLNRPRSGRSVTSPEISVPAGEVIRIVSVSERIAPSFRERGQFAALPNSELNISPIEGSTEGVIVGDVRLMGYGVIRDEPVKIHVSEGNVVDILGGTAAEYLKHTLASFDHASVYNLAEFAVGLNPCSRAYATNLEDLGKLGFAHHGIGSNYAIGGEVLAPCHIDVIYREAKLEFDGKVVLDKGKVTV